MTRIKPSTTPVLRHLEIRKEIGRRIAGSRKAMDMTQDEMAARAGIGVATVRRIESGGQSTIDTFLRITRALGHKDALLLAALPEVMPEDMDGTNDDAASMGPSWPIEPGRLRRRGERATDMFR